MKREGKTKKPEVLCHSKLCACVRTREPPLVLAPMRDDGRQATSGATGTSKGLLGATVLVDGTEAKVQMEVSVATALTVPHSTPRPPLAAWLRLHPHTPCVGRALACRRPPPSSSASTASISGCRATRRASRTRGMRPARMPHVVRGVWGPLPRGAATPSTRTTSASSAATPARYPRRGSNARLLCSLSSPRLHPCVRSLTSLRWFESHAGSAHVLRRLPAGLPPALPTRGGQRLSS